VIDAVRASRQAHQQLLVALEALADVRQWEKQGGHAALPVLS
jgi:hypothetical protein